MTKKLITVVGLVFASFGLSAFLLGGCTYPVPEEQADTQAETEQQLKNMGYVGDAASLEAKKPPAPQEGDTGVDMWSVLRANNNTPEQFASPSTTGETSTPTTGIREGGEAGAQHTNRKRIDTLYNMDRDKVVAALRNIPACQRRAPRGRIGSQHTNRTGSAISFNDGASISAAFPGSVPSPDEELWIIQQPEAPIAETNEEAPGTGSLLAILPGEEKHVPIPLKHTDVQTFISAYIATVEVTQQYHNPYNSKIEAEYVFPLPQNAAVNEFVMTIGERRIRGIIRKRKEAEEIYEEARSQGYVASLLTQERANIFTQKVANIEPDKAIDINIKYFHTLAYRDGWYEYVFPMVVGPRFNPPGSTNGVGAVARGKHGASGQKTEVQYLKPSERSGHDISLAVNIDTGVEIEEVSSSSHVIKVKHDEPGRATVKLSEMDAIPNRDFVLRYKVAGSRIKSALLTHQDKRGGFFSLMMYPPENLASLQRKAVEMVFVIDCSGSMSGEPINQAKTAIKRALKHLQAGDTFQIIRFSNNASQLGSAPVQATPKNIKRGLAYVDGLNGGGGTMMIEGIKAALDFPHNEGRLRFVTFLTDGYIGNEREILGEIHDRLGASRIFSFGVGSSPNRFLLNRMAKLGNGAVAYLSLRDDAGLVMDRFFERISHPALTDISVDWGGMQVTDVFPSRVSDLFVGRPVIVTGRFDGTLPSQITVHGSVGGSNIEVAVNVQDNREARHAGLAAVWARTKIANLADRSTYEGHDDIELAIEQVALEYNLMSAFTSFVAVDSLSKTEGVYGTTVAVPVNMPEGVRYETTVIE